MPISIECASLNQTHYKQMHWTTMLRQMLRFRLARRLFLVVFAAIIVIEFIIVFPSYNNFKDSRLNDYRELARVASIAALAHRMPDGAELNAGLERIMAADARILGASVLDQSGRFILEVGESPELKPEPSNQLLAELYNQSQRYEVYLPGTTISSEAGVIVRMDASLIWNELNAFLIRILGLTPDHLRRRRFNCFYLRCFQPDISTGKNP